jgi:hypothetical protein
LKKITESPLCVVASGAPFFPVMTTGSMNSSVTPPSYDASMAAPG